MSNILSLSSPKAEMFFLKEESYINFDLPSYFNFSNLLSNLSKELKENPLENINRANNEDGVNYKLLKNKDGKYGWRPLQIIHPVLYVSLVHKITKEENWNLIKNRFEYFKESNCVECMSLQVISKVRKLDKAKQVINWYKHVEQKSLALGLEYNYIFETDIENCYCSIYTHSVAWALHNKSFIKSGSNRRDPTLIGNIIDKHIQGMSYGQTNGIPQGSALMDFIAEIVLGYTDTLLAKKLEGIDKSKYRIIRFKDDYRIFVNNPQIGENILKSLSEVLSDLGISLNTQKTKYSNNIIQDSIKSDKLYYITQGNQNDDIQQELIIIYSIAQKFPNSGTVDKALQKLYTKLQKQKNIKSDIHVLISIIVNIALCSPRTYGISSAILSKFINYLNSNREKKEIIEKILKKFSQKPNTGHLQLWLQRISIKLDRTLDYKENLCKVVQDTNSEIKVWNSDWLDSSDLKEIISSSLIINESEISKLDPIIQNKEVMLFRQIYS